MHELKFVLTAIFSFSKCSLPLAFMTPQFVTKYIVCCCS